ncbi:helix-turn-helix transcriptional regulator [Brevibacterium casei]|nr:helix-turn-helix transcriptional regulator [Brevibacterium casei]
MRLDDLAKGAGISAPAVYRHFESKEAVLEELLVGISEYLQSGGAEIAGGAPVKDSTVPSPRRSRLTPPPPTRARPCARSSTSTSPSR